ncbi:DNA/RNA non-specific endonuclease [Flammeovirga aprica]|uniref:Endonuclease n=1 Tax=Flammeovirga aprica JL-4 TaxID=694437 RepID=A0A7X9RY80_9BACT|nr:DNA/RNA non-specific endonuclease [Flammeovirga aprica]NME70911.1 DNA/RNA non-specific endonuclease [Flammeovirga aprica JL-4]
MRFKISFLILFIFTSTQIVGQNLREVPAEIFPSFEKDYLIIRHKNYTIAYSEKHEQAAFVIYKLTKKELYKHEERSNHFIEDPDINTSSANDDDYYQSGYDRGHLAPAADMSFSKTAMEESFFYSNMSPQKPSFNRGIWKRMEEQVRDWAYLKDSLIVITGPVLKDGLEKIGPNKVSVPEYYFKIVLSKTEDGEYEALGLLVENKKSSAPLSQFFVTIDSIEKVTSINFFAGIPIQESFESSYDASYWEIEDIDYVEVTEDEDNDEEEEHKTAHQCEGKTKKGTRCKRNAVENSKYCWQHQ